MRDTWVTSLHAATRRGRTGRRVSLASRAEHRGRTLLAAAIAIGTLIASLCQGQRIKRCNKLLIQPTLQLLASSKSSMAHQ